MITIQARQTSAREQYDAAVGRLVRYHPDVVDIATTLAADHPDFAMGQVLGSYLALTSTDRADVDAARASAAALAAIECTEEEAAHRRAIERWAAGDWHGAARVLDELLVHDPTDVLALMIGHQLDFFVGDSANLRDRVGRSLHAFDADHPHYGFVRGMQAFGLEESGHYERAEAAGLDAVARNPDDVWAIHAVVHVYEMQGRVEEGIRFLQAREQDWGSGNLFTVHNWWHLALYMLEAGRPDEALRIYDAQVHNSASANVSLEMLDASALLWRLKLDDVDTSRRFEPLADAWTPRVEDEPWYAFNDAHGVMALAGAGRFADARRVVERLDRYVATAAPTSNTRMTAEIGLPVSRAILAFAEDRHDEVVRELAPIRRVFNQYGGSHAQRDALQRTLLDAAIRAGELDLARALVSERLSLRDTSVYGWLRRARVLQAGGDTVAARAAEDQAGAHRARFAAAVR